MAEEKRSVSQVTEISSLALKKDAWYGRLYNKVTTKEGWLGNYNYSYMFTPDIYPFNRKFSEHLLPFFEIDEEIPIILMVLLGFQHAFTLIVSLVSVPLLMGQALNFDTIQTQHLITCSLITSGVATFAQITRFKIFKTPYHIGTGLLSVVGPTFDIIGIAFAYTSKRYEDGSCNIAEDGTYLPCKDAFGAILGTMLCTVWIQVLMSFIPPKILRKVFPNLVTGTLLTLLTVYLAGNGMKSWGGGSNCYQSEYKCEMGSYALPWGDRRFIGLGFATFISILVAENFGAPIMKSAAVIIGLLVGSIISAACGYWDATNIKEAPVIDFLWTKNYTFSVDGALVLPFLIMFCVEAVSCIPDIVATSEASRVAFDGVAVQTRIQGGIMCDSLGSVLAACGGGLPMVSQAANNGVILVTGCASRRAGWTAALILILMGIFSKVSATFATMPSPVLGGMQVFLFGTIAVSGVKILLSAEWNRRNRFILGCALGWGFAGAVVPDWFSLVINYKGQNTSLAGFIEGIELVVETPFIFGAIIACVLNLIIPEEKGRKHVDTEANPVVTVPEIV